MPVWVASKSSTYDEPRLEPVFCWCGISQVIGNSVSSAFENAFSIPPIYTTVILVTIAAVIVLRKTPR